jgi:hypothetical protein
MRDKFPNPDNPTHDGRVFTPPAWLSLDEVEDLLLAAIQANEGDESGALAIIDEYFAGDETFEGIEYKRALLRLLGLLWPDVAALIGVPPAKQ